MTDEEVLRFVRVLECPHYRRGYCHIKHTPAGSRMGCQSPIRRNQKPTRCKEFFDFAEPLAKERKEEIFKNLSIHDVAEILAEWIDCKKCPAAHRCDLDEHTCEDALRWSLKEKKS